MKRKQVWAFSFSIFPLTFLVWAALLCLPERAFGQCPTTLPYSSGSGSLTIPAGVTAITVEAWGGGGRGGFWNSSGTGGRGGGGGGGYSRSVISVIPGQTYTSIVGAGSNSDAAGGSSRFFLTAGPGPDLVRAVGGNSAINSITGATGGLLSAGAGDFTRSGGNGSSGSGTFGGGGGSSAGTVLNGVSATNQNGAIAPTGGGNGGNGSSGLEGAGLAGISPGGGGGGSWKTTNANGTRNGGAGANGQIIITYTIPANTVASAAPNQTRCINVALANITHNTTGATGIGAATGLPSGVTAAWAGNTITISGTPTVSGAFNYSIPLTGGCNTPAVNATGTITVTPDNTAGIGSSTPTLCINNTLTAITHTTSGATGIGVATGLPGGVTAAWASNSITISGTPSSSGTFNYSIPLIGGCGSVNATGTIIIDAQAAINSPSLGTQTRCLNVAFNPISVGPGQGFTFQWYSNPTNVNSGGTLSPGATSNSFTPPSSIVGTFYYYVEVSSLTCGTTETSAASGAFIVNALPVVSFDTQPAVGNYCVDTDIITYSTQPGQLNYVWTIPGLAGTDYTITSMSGVTLATSNSITLNYKTAGNKTITVNYQDANGCGSTAPITSNTITVQKNTLTPVGNPSLTSVCVNTILPTTNTHTTSGATGIGTIVWTTSNPVGITATWSGNTISLSSNGNPVTAAPGIYDYSIPLTGGCGAVNATGTITVNPNNTAGAASSTPTICINTALTNITHATTGASGIGAATGLPAGVTAAWASNTITISGTPTASGAFNYSIPLTGGCNTPVIIATGTITVTPNNIVSSASSAPTLCINTGPTAITHTTTGATGIGAATGLPTGVTASWAGNIITISGTPTGSGTFNYSIALTGGCNTPAVFATGTIIVTPNNTVTSAAPNQTRCINVALANITHTTTGATGIGTATGLPSGVTATWAGNTITISGTPTTSGPFNYSIPLTGGCNTPAVNATGTITVTPNNTVSVASSSPTLCINTALTSITHTTTGSTGIGAATGLPAGVTASRSGNTITISGTPTASGNFSYSIPLTGGCNSPAVIATGTITVTPNNTVSTASSSPTLCINIGLTPITHTTTGATGIGVATGLPAGVTAAWGSNTITISGTPTASGTFNYSIPLAGGCNTPAVNATGTITVTPNNTVTSAVPNQTGCINVALTNITHTTNGATGIGATTGLPAGVTAAWVGNIITISGTPTASGTFNYSIPLIGGCNTPAVNATGTITVTANNSISAASSSPTLCINTGLTAITFNTTGATGIGAATGLPAGVAASWNAGVITVSGTPSASGTFNYSIPLTGGCNTPSVNATGTITVNPATTIVSESLSAQSICNGQNFTSISINATGTGTLVYQWYTNTANNNTTGTSIAGANSSSYTPPSSPLGTKYYYVTVSSNCGPLLTSSISGAFTIDPITSITTQPDTSNQVECFGDGFNPISVSAIGGGLTYQWYRNPTSSNLNGISVPGANTPTFTPPSNSQGIAYYYVIVTGNCGTQTSTVSGEFLVNPPVTTISNPSTSPQTVCLGAPFNAISVTATGEGTVTYQWYSNSNNSNSGGTVVPGATLPSFTPPSTPVGTIYYYAVASSNCGTVPSAVSGAFTVTPLTNIDTESLGTQSICFGNTFTSISVTALGTGTLTYQWYTNTANNNTTGTPISLATSSSYTPPSSSAGTNYYYVIVSSACGPNKISSASGAFTVIPTNTAGAPSSTPTLCINTALTNITHTTTGATGIGVATGLPAGVTATWSGNTITIFGTPTTSGTFNYTVPLSGGCNSPVINATGSIIVEPIATVSLPSVPFPSVCISSPILTPFTQTTTGVTTLGVPTGLPPGITTSFNPTTGVITFSGTATTTGLYSYTIPLIGNCINGLKATGTIDVTPVYDITSVSSVSATTIGGTATVTFFGNPLTMLNGTYQITYQIKQASGAFTTVGPVNATIVNGKGTFSTTPINSTVDTYTVQILTIKKSTDVCTVTLPIPPTTYFGVCSAVFSANSTFYVPANVYSITIEVYGGGGGGNSGGGGGGGYTIRKNIPVTPGEPLGVIFLAGGGKGVDGGVTYVTRDSNIANQLGNSLVLANGGKSGSSANALGGTFDPRFTGSNGNPASGTNGGKAGGPLGGAGGGNNANGNPPGGGGGGNGIGGKGLIVISYSCPDSDNTDCIKVIDDGSKSGTTVIEFTCNDTWTAPEGLVEFTTYVGSGGGGGGSGFGSGGGGSGALIQQIFSTSNPNGLPSGTSFAITVGDGGNGATGSNTSGMNGNPSSFSGSIDGSSINIFVAGGGGGGSQSSIPGANGASGGGGGARPNPTGQGGQGGNSIPITYTGTGINLYQGNFGGNGEYSGSQNSIAGGGGGGLVAWTSADQRDGKAAGNGQGEGGDGGKGVPIIMGDSLRYFGAGGGGIGEYFNGTEKVGIGGSSESGIKLGGDGNLANPTAIGGAGRNKTGSGGGAGYGAGGKGAKGIVYITFANFRILEVEYEYITASYSLEKRFGLLNWATAKEWENSHFEIERSINGVSSWTKIGEIEGQGYSEISTEYAFTDTELPASGGIAYYRLKQVDFDGKFSYSVTKSIKVEGINGKGAWIAYPNPSSKRNTVTVDLLNRSVYKDEKIIIQISDIRGVAETFTVDKVEVVSEVVNAYLERSNQGVYILQLFWGNNAQQLKLLRE